VSSVFHESFTIIAFAILLESYKDLAEPILFDSILSLSNKNSTKSDQVVLSLPIELAKIRVQSFTVNSYPFFAKSFNTSKKSFQFLYSLLTVSVI
jgi:hypothetical protein